jgi:C4-type Zn-finger protein
MPAHSFDERSYLKAHGGKCPWCDSLDIQGNNTDFEGGRVYQDVCCNDCGGEWTDMYALTSAEPVRDPDENDNKSEDPLEG